jgi:DNA-binding winged helix-turn-helix (wHTH) protein
MRRFAPLPTARRRLKEAVTDGTVYKFSLFRLDSRSGRLWKGWEFRPLRAKTFALLQQLVAHPGELLLKEDLLEALWPGLAITESGLSVCIYELRKALDDDPQSPRFVETVHRRGYRFVALVEALAAGEDAEKPLYVGREAELARLGRAWQLALAGARQGVFLSGEAGIGKSALADSLTRVVRSSARPLIGRGQCAGRDGGGRALPAGNPEPEADLPGKSRP